MLGAASERRCAVDSVTTSLTKLSWNKVFDKKERRKTILVIGH